MKASPRTGTIPWADVFELRYRQDSKKPLHVQVVEVGHGVPHVRTGDELFLHEITTDEISLKRRSNSFSSQDRRHSEDWQGAMNNDVEILLPLQYGAGFMLCPRYPMSYCFQSVREIIDALPAVSRIIYPCEGFDVGKEMVKAMERLEIIDQIRDPLTGMEMLNVRSMKTESQMLLPANMRKTFVQLSNDCFKCGPGGITAAECMMGWKPGLLPFQVKLCPPREKEKQATLKVPKLKRDKKDKKKKHSSWGDFDNIKISDLQSEPDDRWLIPETWRDQPLYIKPLQKIRVQNIMFTAKDFMLAENAKLTVLILSSDSVAATEGSIGTQEKRDRIVSASGRFSGQLCQLPIELITKSTEPLPIVVTGGEVATTIRQQMKISQGCRLVIHRVQQSEKILMVCDRGNRLLVSRSYGGTFRRITGSRIGPEEFRAKEIMNIVPPCKVQVTQGDQSLGYDQLARREVLTMTEMLPETTLFVEVISADGTVTSEQPFEIPLSRTNLSVKVLDSKSLTLTGSVPLECVRHLPAVEFITEAHIQTLKTPIRRESIGPESPFSPVSPIFPMNAKEDFKVSIQRLEDLYTSPVKHTRSANTDGQGLFDTPPQRPPKSPNLIKHSHASPTQTEFFPPARPPKPERYRDAPLNQTYNFSNNSNKVLKEPSGAEQIRNKTQLLREARWMKNHNCEQDLLSLVRDSRVMLDVVGKRASVDIGSFSNEAKNLVTSFPKPAPRTRQPRMRSFENLHKDFDPTQFNVVGELITIREDTPSSETQDVAVGIYGQRERPKPNTGFIKALKRARQGQNKRGISIVNPNYGEMLGQQIHDPALEKSGQEDDDSSSEDESIYAVADDFEDYETPSSPKIEQSGYYEEEPYLCMTPKTLGREVKRTPSAGEDGYEGPIYDDVDPNS